MLKDELISFVRSVQQMKTEDGQVEIKAAREGAPKIYDTLSSFSNQAGGGTILFGVDEKDYSVCGVYDADDLQTKISERCLQMEPPVRAICTVAEVEGKTVVGAEIPEIEMAKRPCYYKGAGRIQGSYVRVGDGDYKMTEYEIYSYEAFRQKTQDELRPAPRAGLGDIQTTYLDGFFGKVATAKPRLAEQSQERQSQLLGFQVENSPTLAGILLFSDYPQSFFPRLCLTAVVVPGTSMGEVSALGERFIDNQTIEGTLHQILEGALRFVRRNMKVATRINPTTGLRDDIPQYPILAVREIILNALIHRDYSIHTDSTPITLVMYQDRLEVENPGGLYGRLTLDRLGHVSADTRNPFIAGAMEVSQDTENRFSGIPTIRREMEKTGLPAPVFENSRGVFKVTLYHQPVPESEKQYGSLQDQIWEFCAQPRTREELAGRFTQISKIYLFTNYVNPLVEQGELALGLPQKPRSKHQTYLSVINPN